MLMWELCGCNNIKMINETQQGHEQKYEFTYMFCSIIHNSIFLLLLLLLLFLLLLCNFAVATITLHMRNANRVLHQGSLTFAVRCTQLRCLMRKVVLHNEYHCVVICQIDGIRICINWSGEKIVCITFLYIACKNM